jgi:hypothetical protein
VIAQNKTEYTNVLLHKLHLFLAANTSVASNLSLNLTLAIKPLLNLTTIGYSVADPDPEWKEIRIWDPESYIQELSNNFWVKECKF